LERQIGHIHLKSFVDAMSVSVYATSAPPPQPPQMSGIHPMPMARPQVSIERLPTRRMSNEPRESMNCKSCRKRKVRFPLASISCRLKETDGSDLTLSV
jgi:hypothetical protein